MSQLRRALAVLAVALPIVVASANTIVDERASAASPAAVPAAASQPIADHPPITVSGVVKGFDPATDVLSFEDGRMVKLTGRSTVAQPAGAAIRAGDRVVLQDVLPVGVHAGVKVLAVGKPQRMAVVSAVDEPTGLVRLADGSIVRVTGSTNVHLGAAGSSVALTELAPGDQVVIVLTDPADPGEAASALPRQDLEPRPFEAAEVMLFRVPR